MSKQQYSPSNTRNPEPQTDTALEYPDPELRDGPLDFYVVSQGNHLIPGAEHRDLVSRAESSMLRTKPSMTLCGHVDLDLSIPHNRELKHYTQYLRWSSTSEPEVLAESVYDEHASKEWNHSRLDGFPAAEINEVCEMCARVHRIRHSVNDIQESLAVFFNTD